jgi:hypothetical protein
MEPPLLRRIPDRSRRLRGFLPAFTLLVLCGCALIPGRKTPAPTEPPASPVGAPATQEIEGPASDTLPPAPARVAPPPVRREARPDTTASARRPAAPVVAPAEPAMPVLIQLTDEERVRLTEETNKDLALTNVCLQRIDRSRLSRERAQALADVEDLLQSVMKARGSNDIQAAARLARKARLLAEDLVGR